MVILTCRSRHGGELELWRISIRDYYFYSGLFFKSLKPFLLLSTYTQYCTRRAKQVVNTRMSEQAADMDAPATPTASVSVLQVSLPRPSVV